MYWKIRPLRQFAPQGPRDCLRAISSAEGCILPREHIFQFILTRGSVLPFFFQNGSILEITLQTAGVYWQYINSIHSRSIKKNDKYKVWIYSLRFCTKILKPIVKLTKESEKLKSFIAAVMNLEVSDEEPLLQERVWHLLCLFCLLKISPLCFNVCVD